MQDTRDTRIQEERHKDTRIVVVIVVELFNIMTIKIRQYCPVFRKLLSASMASMASMASGPPWPPWPPWPPVFSASGPPWPPVFSASGLPVLSASGPPVFSASGLPVLSASGPYSPIF
jgi:hypothetical protein